MGSNGTFSGGRQRVALAWTVRFATLFPVASEPHRSKVQEVLSNIRLCMWLIFVSETHADGDRARAAARPPAGPRGRAVSSTGGYLGEASAHMRGTATRNNSKLKITQHLRELKLKIKPPGSRAGPPQLPRSPFRPAARGRRRGCAVSTRQFRVRPDARTRTVNANPGET